MDIADNDSFPMHSPLPEEETAAPQEEEAEHLPEPTHVGDRPKPSARETPEEVREAKIRALQDAIKNGTYDVPAEQIASKMLRSHLR